MRLFADHTFPFDFRIACAVIVNVPVARAELRGLLAAVLDADVIPEDEAAEDRKGSTTAWSTPQAESSVNLSRSVAMRGGASSGFLASAAK